MAKKQPDSGRHVSPEQRRKNEVTDKAIAHVAGEVYQAILKGQKPDLTMPVRSLSNVKYEKKRGYFEIGRARSP